MSIVEPTPAVSETRQLFFSSTTGFAHTVMSTTERTKAFLSYQQELKGYIFALTRDIEVAEEVFQEVALAILSDAHPERTIQDFGAWSREVARRRVQAYYRKRTQIAKHESPSSELIELVSQAFDENESSHDRIVPQLKHLQDCVQKLSVKQRDLVLKRYQQSLNIKEIATTAGMTENSVMMTLSRIRKVLADCIRRKERAALSGIE